MKPVMKLACLILFRVGVYSRFTSTVTPVQQVLNMLGQLKTKGKQQMEEEQKIYATYAEWVDDTSRQLGFDIQTAKTSIEQLEAAIAKAENDVARLGKAINALDAEIDGLKADLARATKQRTTEHNEFLETEADLSESVDALMRAIDEVQAQDYSRPEATALLQRMAVETRGMRRVLALLGENKAEPGAPAVAAYEFQSGTILAVLKKLSKKFQDELFEVQRSESERDNAYQVEKIHLDNAIAKNTADRDDRAATKAKRNQDAVKARAELAETRKSLAEDEKFLAEVQATFEVKTQNYKENQEVRTNELTALSKAIQIISSPAVSESYASHINLAQTSFLQLRRSKTQMERARDAAAAYLSSRATALSSDVLSAAAKQLGEGNPFKKVIDMIESLLARLKEEASAEANHKAWCDEQLKNNKLKRERKTAKVEKLSAEIDALTSDIVNKADRITTLAEEQAELTKQMNEATKIRTAEKAENLATIADAKAGNAAVNKALVILKEFYASQAALLQTSKQVPEMAAYKGMQNAKGGVIGMLEVIASDFARLDSETSSAEAAAAKEYKSFMAESEAARQAKHEEEIKLRLEKDQAEFEKGQTIKERKIEQEILDRANEYFEYLKPNCVQVQVDWETRVARRQEEIAALKEAYKILDSKSSE